MCWLILIGCGCCRSRRTRPLAVIEGLSVCDEVWTGFGSWCRQVSAASRACASDSEITDAGFGEAVRAVSGAL